MAPPVPVACDRHPHLAAPVREGFVRVDLHTHTMWSGDSTSTPDELGRSIAEAALDVVCITDHQSIAGAEEIAAQLPCRVVVGEEVRTSSGELIGLFLTKRIPAGGRPVEVAEQIREQGGVVYVPHPFDPMRRNLSEPALYDLAERGLLDAIEVLNSKTSLASLNARAAEFAAEFDLAGGAGSDAHVPDAIGAACVEMPEFDTPAEFVAALRSGSILGHHWDEPRPWSPRIVPSTSTYRSS